MVPIYDTSAQSLQYLYYSIIEDYIDIVKSFIGLIVSSIRNVCAEFGIYFSKLFFFLETYDI